MNYQKIEQNFNDNDRTLSGLVLQPENSKIDTILLHGAGSASMERSIYLAEYLAENGHGSYAFDFIGHGKTGGELMGSTLQDRITHTQRALKFLNEKNIIIGSSMGGHVATKIGTEHGFGSILLFCPAIYPDESVNIPFGDDFTRIIRMPDAWKKSQLFEKVKKFKGNIIIIIGEHDEVIPKELPSMLVGNALNAKHASIITVPNATHRLQSFLLANNKERQYVLSKISEIVCPDNHDYQV